MRGAAAGVRRAPVLLTNKVPVTSTTCVHARRRNTEHAAPTPETIDGRRGAGRARGKKHNTGRTWRTCPASCAACTPRCTASTFSPPCPRIPRRGSPTRGRTRPHELMSPPPHRHLIRRTVSRLIFKELAPCARTRTVLKKVKRPSTRVRYRQCICRRADTYSNGTYPSAVP